LADPMIDGTIRGVKIRALARLIAAIAFAALLSAGCTGASRGRPRRSRPR
jgi:hypothetical protein